MPKIVLPAGPIKLKARLSSLSPYYSHFRKFSIIGLGMQLSYKFFGYLSEYVPELVSVSIILFSKA